MTRPLPTRLARKLGLALAIVLGLALALELGIRAVGCAFTTQQERANERIEIEGALTVLCLGDSMTAMGGEDAYPRQLERVLEERGEGLRFHVINAGVPGTDSSAALADLPRLLREHQPSVVTVMMGINGQQGGPPARTNATTTAGIPALLMRLRIVRLLEVVRRDARQAEALRVRDREHLAREDELLRQVQGGRAPAAARDLVRMYEQDGREDEARALLQDLVQRRPDPALFCELGRLEEDPAQAEAVFLDAIARFPSAPRPYRNLRRHYLTQDRQADAEALMLAWTDASPSVMSFLELAALYRDQERHEDAERAILRSLEVERNHYSLYVLGILYEDWQRYELAEQALQGSVELAQCRDNQLVLGRLLRSQGALEQAELVLQQARSSQCDHQRYSLNRQRHDPNDILVELARVHRARGDEERALEVLAAAAPSQALFDSYQRLLAQVGSEPGRLVAIQYPLRSPASLRAMLSGEDGVVVVGNQRAFARGVAEHGYQAYFQDHSGVDFGHCTAAGNRLIAETVARAILGKWFEVDMGGTPDTGDAGVD